jgi:TolB-like protein/AraC-like DNA-binding protein
MSEKLSNTEIILLDRINQLIDENLDNHSFASDTICKELGISRSQLFRLVKDYSQVSISIYIRQRKLLHAKNLLDNTDLKISEITYKIGIDSPQSFSKYFTDVYGISPTEYRKNKLKTESKEGLVVNETENKLPATLIPKLQSNNYRYYGIGVILFLLGIGIYFFQNKAKENSLSTENVAENSDNSIVILPFKNLGSPETAYFADGLMGQVHSSLTLLENLKVISKNSSQLFKGSKKTIKQIANELQVAYILDGTVSHADKKVIVSIELIKASEDRTVWSKSFDGETKEVFAFMNKVAEEIAKELNLKLSASQTKSIEKQPTESVVAYNEYLQGIELIKTRKREKLEAGIVKFERAIALDPKFADAYAAKASVYFIMTGFNFINPKLSVKLAEKDALDAIRLDEKNGTAYAVLAGCYQIQHKWEQAITTFQIALKHSPNDALINYWYGLALRSLGAFDSAIKYGKKAADLDPLTVITYTGYINSCSFAGKFDLAKKAIDEKELIFNEHFMYFFARGTYYLCKEDYKQAIKEFQKVDSMSKDNTATYAITFCQAKLGERAAPLNFISVQPKTSTGYRNMAYAYAGLGDKDNCLKYLNLLTQEDILPNYVMVDPYFKLLHGDKRFNDLLLKFGLLNAKIDVE